MEQPSTGFPSSAVLGVGAVSHSLTEEKAQLGRVHTVPPLTALVTGITAR
jgi:hypothetical protein